MTALGDPTRQAIFERLVERPRPVGELAAELPVSRPAVSQHLKVLKDAGLVVDRKAGTRRVYQVDPQALADLRAYFDAFWDQSLAAFRNAAEQEDEMVEQRQESSATVALQQSILVQAPQERAFVIFTERMGSWWPLETHVIGGRPAVDAVVEPRAGGRWYERSEDGSECDWGRVLAWEPPHRVVLEWQVSGDWRHDPTIHTEVEVRFSAEGAHRTRVDLEHRGLEAYGERTEELRGVYDSQSGWPGLLARFAQAAGA